MNALKKLIASLLFALISTSAFAITDVQVFTFAEANYPSIFSGTATSGQYLQYNYRYYPASGNYLAVDTSGMISIFGPYTGNVITSVGLATAYAPTITAWEATQGGGTTTGGTPTTPASGVTLSAAFNGTTSVTNTLAGNQLSVTNSITHSGTWGSGTTLVVNHYIKPASESVTIMAQGGSNLAYLNLPSPRDCYLFGGPTGTSTCASVGIAFDRAAGKVTFTNTPMDNSMTLTGSLSFPAF